MTLPATAFAATSDSQIQVTTPASVNPGTADISLLSATGSTLYVEFGGLHLYRCPGSFHHNICQPTANNQSSNPAPNQTANQTQANQGKDASQAKDTSKAATTPDPNATPKDTTAAKDTTNANPAPDKTTDTTGNETRRHLPTPQADVPWIPAGRTSSTPTPSGDYIPLGRVPVADGKTGLGGTAGTGAGFGVGTLMAGGGGSAAPSNLSYYVDPGLTTQIVQSLLTMAQAATSPDAIEAQNMLLRRMALEGDVVGSRIPPPRNISEIGGYINLLGNAQRKHNPRAGSRWNSRSSGSRPTARLDFQYSTALHGRHPQRSTASPGTAQLPAHRACAQRFCCSGAERSQDNS